MTGFELTFHRRANLLPNRFKAIIRGVIKLVKQGYNVNFIEMTANKKALEHYGLREKLKKLDKENKNFLMTDLWKKARSRLRVFGIRVRPLPS